MPRSQFTQTREFGRFPRGRLAFASSPIHFPFLLRTAPEYQLRNESVPQPCFSLQHVGWGAKGRGGWQECFWEAWTGNRVFPFGRHSDYVLNP